MTIVELLLWMGIGALVGGTVGAVLERRTRMGPLANIIVGVVGALIGGFILHLAGLMAGAGIDAPSLLAAAGGAAGLLFLLGHVGRE
jgi:uncharacterized membrane protein YeaQ/YmgE (transglycosylase-associated protein family)